MRLAHPQRLVGLLAALALLVATTAYLSHVHHASGGPGGDKYCGLCLQLGGTAGPAAHPAPLPGPPPALLAVVLPAADAVVPQRSPRAHRSRGPPLHSTVT